jgi:ketosteroid isomerase-like protein
LRLGLLATVLVAVILASGCGTNRQKEIETLKSQIEAVNGQFADAFARRDVAALGALYATDAQAFPPGLGPVAGRASIQDMWKGFLAMPVGRIQLLTVEVDGNGETAWEEGRYTLVGQNGATMDVGKYVVIWKHQPDGWKLYRDMWSSNTPQQAAPAGQPAPTH